MHAKGRPVSRRPGALCVRAARTFGYRPAVVCNARMVSQAPPSGAMPACALALLLAAAPALADEPPAPPPPAGQEAPADAPGPAAAAAATTTKTPAADLDELRALSRVVELDKRILGSLEFGRGFRFNNPYRLATELGKTAQSVSLIAPYADLGAAIAFGPPDGLQHGGALHASFAMSGIPQAVLTPAYLMAYRGPRPFLAYGRVGPSIVLSPDATVGAELAGGFAWFLTSHLAVASELVFDVYWGAGTHHVAVATYPILSGQLGLLADFELLP